jgi:hypothetical protein
MTFYARPEAERAKQGCSNYLDCVGGIVLGA